MKDNSPDQPRTGAMTCLYAILAKLNEPNLGDRHFFEWLDCASIDYIKGANAELVALRTRLEEAERDLGGLRFFAGMAIREVRGSHVGNDWDGGSIQDAMVASGILRSVEATESCGEGCNCEDFPTICYRLTPLGLQCDSASSETLSTPSKEQVKP